MIDTFGAFNARDLRVAYSTVNTHPHALAALSPPHVFPLSENMISIVYIHVLYRDNVIPAERNTYFYKEWMKESENYSRYACLMCVFIAFDIFI